MCNKYKKCNVIKKEILIIEKRSKETGPKNP